MTETMEIFLTPHPYIIRLRGCDDSTYVLAHLDPLAQMELDLVAAKLRAASDYDCKPTMYVTALSEASCEAKEAVGLMTDDELYNCKCGHCYD